MNPKKQKEKDRRRARKLADEAWEAANNGNLDLAEKIVRRAVAAHPDNPVLWTDQGAILGLRRKDAESAEAYRAAISLAPTFAEPYAALAALHIRQGFAHEAVALQTQAVKHAPQNVIFAEQLSAYQSFLPAAVEELSAANSERAVAPQPGLPCGNWPDHLATFDWRQLGERLTREGCILLPGLVDASTCAQLRAMFAEDSRFAKTVIMDRPEFGLGEYRYFRAPIPDEVDQLRRAAYPHIASIANGWQRLLGEPERYPSEWEAFRDECRRARQTVPTPILLKYGPGGFNALHRDLRGAVFFPIQLAVILSRRGEPPEIPDNGFTGGEFLFCDVPERKKSRRREIAAGLGDAVLFCTRDRLVPVGGVYGLQPVKHGVMKIMAGERYVLGIPFHEYR